MTALVGDEDLAYLYPDRSAEASARALFDAALGSPETPLSGSVR